MADKLYTSQEVENDPGMICSSLMTGMIIKCLEHHIVMELELELYKNKYLKTAFALDWMQTQTQTETI